MEQFFGGAKRENQPRCSRYKVLRKEADRLQKERREVSIVERTSAKRVSEETESGLSQRVDTNNMGQDAAKACRRALGLQMLGLVGSPSMIDIPLTYLLLVTQVFLINGKFEFPVYCMGK